MVQPFFFPYVASLLLQPLALQDVPTTCLIYYSVPLSSDKDPSFPYHSCWPIPLTHLKMSDHVQHAQSLAQFSLSMPLHQWVILGALSLLLYYGGHRLLRATIRPAMRAYEYPTEGTRYRVQVSSYRRLNVVEQERLRTPPGMNPVTIQNRGFPFKKIVAPSSCGRCSVGL